MAVRFGQITGFQARKTFQCIICKEMICAGDLYILTTIVHKGYTTRKAHKSCWLEKFRYRMYQLGIYNKNPSGMRVTRLNNLTVVQRNRRKVLQTYLTTRDIPALRKAYEQKSTMRVIKVMDTIANRWEEFAEMNIKPKLYIFERGEPGQHHTSLDHYISYYDREWLENVFKENLTLKEQAKALHRTIEDEYLPDWSLS